MRFTYEVRLYAIVFCFVEYDADDVFMSNNIESTLYDIDVRATCFNHKDKRI